MNDLLIMQQPAAGALTRADFLRASALTVGGLAFGGTLASCGSDNGGAANRTLRLGLSQGNEYGYPNPYGYSKGPGYWQTSYIFDPLIWKDSTGKFIPWLATSWSTPDKGLTWRFKLRDGVKWHDGQPFTAEDVAFTYKYVLDNPPPPTVPFRLAFVKGAKVIDAQTVDILLMKPFAGFLSTVAGSQPILPKHIWEKVTKPAAFRGAQSVIGTGAYTLDSYSAAKGTYSFNANDKFFLGKPYIERIENPAVADELLALRNGDIDAGAANTNKSVQAALQYFRDNNDFEVIQGPPDAVMALYFRLTSGGALADPRFRRAVALAVNREDIAKRLFQGGAVAGNPGWFPPTSEWHTDVEQYPFNLEKARADLDAAGYKEQGGVRRDPDGNELSFKLSMVPMTGAKVTELLVSYLKPLGITVQPRPTDQATHDKITSSGKYELALVNYGGMGGDPDYMRVVFTAPAPQFQVVYGYDNPQFTAVANKQAFTQDVGARHDLVDKGQQILAKDLPILSLYYPYYHEAFRKAAFDQWYYTPGGFGGRIPTVYNKQVLITGQKTGTEIKA